MTSVNPRARLYCSYKDSTSETIADHNVWQVFPFPSTSITNHRDSGHFTVSDSSGLTFTYSGITAWFDVSAMCNAYKGSGSNATRNIETQWKVNGIAVGAARGSHMNNHDSVILTGFGQMLLHNGDVVQPTIRNIENGDKINLKACDFIFKEDSSWGE